MRVVSVQMKEDENGPAIRLSQDATAADVEQLILLLGQHRERIAPPISSEAPKPGDSAKNVVVNPMFAAGPTLAGNLLIGFRHPWYGWVNFQLDHEFAQTLQEGLDKFHDGTALPPGQAN